ncbi:collagen alpha-1(X) chain-like [Musca vetustissima]|uniref:collagen alpha-1(X) chain-like n=1 Tax=Musca vetustissima TaxID=27455 RepID=UPI002AB757EC|nr:collagen alpha-1(X) chain-like [Musca vetustissima]
MLASIPSISLLGSVVLVSQIIMSSGTGQNGWGNTGASSWSSSSSSGLPGQPPQNDFSYSYGGVDANGVPYGGYGGNGGFHINVNDAQGRSHTYSGGNPTGFPGAPGFTGVPPGAPQPGQPGYPGPFSYSTTNTQYGMGPDGRPYANSSSSSSAWSSASAWSTFYVIALFSLYAMMKF